MTTAMTPTTGIRRLGFAFVLTALLFTSIELLSYAAIALAPASLHTDRAATRLAAFARGAEVLLEQRADAMAVFHPTLGWRPNVGLHTAETRINAQGLRSDRTYSEFPADSVTRVSAFGDSFVYGHEVRLEAAWPALIEANTDDIEVLNYGVTGYGPDQAYLRFAAEAESSHPHVVIWAVSPWMMNRIVSVFRPFLTQGNAFAVKPRFILGPAGELVLVPQPISALAAVQRFIDSPNEITTLGENDYFYDAQVYENPLHDYVGSMRLFTAISSSLWRRYLDPERVLTGPPGDGLFNIRSEAFRITQALMERFAAEALKTGAQPVVMTVPDIHVLRRVHEGLPGIGSSLHATCRGAGLVCWDASEAFADALANAKISDWFMPGGHYSPEGNRILARWLETQIRALSGQRAERNSSPPDAELGKRGAKP